VRVLNQRGEEIVEAELAVRNQERQKPSWSHRGLSDRETATPPEPSLPILLHAYLIASSSPATAIGHTYTRLRCHSAQAQRQKIYGPTPGAERRYSPPECIGCETRVVEGNPNPRHISSSVTI
jgi:hypothetical protein